MRKRTSHTALSRRLLLKQAAAVGVTAVGATLPAVSMHLAADGPVTFSIGASVQGRPITAIRFGQGPVRVLVIGGIHTGYELNTADLVTEFVQHFRANPGDVPAAVTLTLIPALNVDGVALETRTNVHGVDLNRNWPARWQPQADHGDELVSGGTAPLSEPETAALYALLQAYRPHVVLSWHSQYPPSGEAEGDSAALGVAGGVTGKTLAQAFAASAGADYLEQWTAYPITGQLLDTLNDLGLVGMDIELPSHEGTYFAENLAGLQRVMADVANALT